MTEAVIEQIWGKLTGITTAAAHDKQVTLITRYGCGVPGG